MTETNINQALQGMFKCSKAQAEQHGTVLDIFFVSTELFEEIINNHALQKDAVQKIEGKRTIRNVRLDPTNDLLVTIIEDNKAVPTEAILEQQWEISC